MCDPEVVTLHEYSDGVVYYEETNRELKRILIYECRCNERLKVKTEESTRLGYTWLRVGLEQKLELMIYYSRIHCLCVYLQLYKKMRRPRV